MPVPITGVRPAVLSGRVRGGTAARSIFTRMPVLPSVCAVRAAMEAGHAHVAEFAPGGLGYASMVQAALAAS